MKKIILLIIITLLFIPFNVSAREYHVSTENEFIEACSSQTENTTIYLENDIKLNNKIDIIGNILIKGQGKKISFKDSYYGKLFEVTGTLEIHDTILDGGNNWSWKNKEDIHNPDILGDSDTLNIPGGYITDTIISVTGNLKLKDSIIQNYFINEPNADQYYILLGNNENSKIILESTTVDNNYGVIIKMNNGKVELNAETKFINNYGYGNKGGIIQQNGGIFNLNSAIIKNNAGYARSGSIIGAINNAYIIMNDGIISKNISKYWGSTSTGSMITVESGAGFTMNGGAISNNIGTLASAISSRWTNSPNDNGIYLNKGVIKNNTTYKTTWLNAAVFVRSSLTIGKDMLIEDDIVINNTNASLENNGTVMGKVTLNDISASAINNGTIKEVNLLAGNFINAGTINKAYEYDTQINNQGRITDIYEKKLTEVSGKIIITFNLNNGKEINTGYTLLDKLYDTNYVLQKTDIPIVEKHGYTFDSWYLDSDYKTQFRDTTPLTTSLEVYAKYIPNKYKVTWDTGTNKIEQEFMYGEKITIPKNITKKGYLLIGWENYQNNMTMPANDMYFKAIWKEKELSNPNTGISSYVFIITTIILIVITSYYQIKKDI